MDTVTKTAAELVVGDILMGRYPERITSVTLTGQSRCGADMYKIKTEGVMHPGHPFGELNCPFDREFRNVQPASRNLEEALARLTRTIAAQLDTPLARAEAELVRLENADDFAALSGRLAAAQRAVAEARHAQEAV